MRRKQTPHHQLVLDGILSDEADAKNVVADVLQRLPPEDHRHFHVVQSGPGNPFTWTRPQLYTMVQAIDRMGRDKLDGAVHKG